MPVHDLKYATWHKCDLISWQAFKNKLANSSGQGTDRSINPTDGRWKVSIKTIIDRYNTHLLLGSVCTLCNQLWQRQAGQQSGSSGNSLVSTMTVCPLITLAATVNLLDSIAMWNHVCLLNVSILEVYTCVSSTAFISLADAVNMLDLCSKSVCLQCALSVWGRVRVSTMCAALWISILLCWGFQTSVPSHNPFLRV